MLTLILPNLKNRGALGTFIRMQCMVIINATLSDAFRGVSMYVVGLVRSLLLNQIRPTNDMNVMQQAKL